MRAQCAAAAAFGLTFLLSGCGTDSVYGVANSIRFSYPTMGFAGAYAKHLTLDDVRQIVQLAKDRPDILKPVDQLVIEKSDEAEVHTGNPRTSGDRACSFHARKLNGRWYISDKPYCTNETIITA